jgi:menaquinol-cytochrome c reductase cytochrome b/c subunit
MATTEDVNKPADEQQAPDDSIPFFPDHARTEAYVALGVLVLIVIIGVLGQISPIGLEDPADPMNTPDHTKPEWYFLFLYQFLKYVPKTVGVMTPIIGVLILLFWPFLDRKREDSPQSRRRRTIGVIAFLAFFVILTALGVVA